MSKTLFITGTGTDVGKTYVTALIVKKLREAGMDAGYFKSAVSGNERVKGELVPGDAAFVKDFAGIPGDSRDMVPYIYEGAVSPHLAARIEGNPPTLEGVKTAFGKQKKQYDYVTVEGSGGILCPLRFDQTVLWLEDILRAFELPSLIVAEAGLGSINAVGLTAAYMKKQGLPVKGIILNHFHPGDVMEEDNLKMIEALTEIPVIACVKDNDRELEVDLKVLCSLYKRN